MERDAMNFHSVTGRADSTRDTTSTRADLLTRALGVVALIGVAFITVTCVLVQFLRTDLDWITVSMSIYVKRCSRARPASGSNDSPD